MASKFTWHEKFTDTLKKVPEEYRGELALAMIFYGTDGVEPEFSEWGLSSTFEGMRDDIDNSVRARNENGGGRPPKTGVINDDNGGLDGCCGGGNGGSSEVKPPLAEGETQTIPNHTNTNHTKPKKEKVSRFVPPSVDEVRDYCTQKGYGLDPEQFVAFYESNGWKVGKNPMKSWKSACVTWQKRRDGDKKGGVSCGDDYSAL